MPRARLIGRIRLSGDGWRQGSIRWSGPPNRWRGRRGGSGEGGRLGRGDAPDPYGGLEPALHPPYARQLSGVGSRRVGPGPPAFGV